MVACPSGLRSTPRKRVWGKLHRGFKSHRHRQFVEFLRLKGRTSLTWTFLIVLQPLKVKVMAELRRAN